MNTGFIPEKCNFFVGLQVVWLNARAISLPFIYKYLLLLYLQEIFVFFFNFFGRFFATFPPTPPPILPHIKIKRPSSSRQVIGIWWNLQQPIKIVINIG